MKRVKPGRMKRSEKADRSKTPGRMKRVKLAAPSSSRWNSAFCNINDYFALTGLANDFFPQPGLGVPTGVPHCAESGDMRPPDSGVSWTTSSIEFGLGVSISSQKKKCYVVNPLCFSSPSAKQQQAAAVGSVHHSSILLPGLHQPPRYSSSMAWRQYEPAEEGRGGLSSVHDEHGGGRRELSNILFRW
nr:hypothetical protein Itr_chr05CG12220 [Ipomoea trifida]